MPVSRTVQEEIDLIESDLDKESDEAMFWKTQTLAIKEILLKSNAGTASSKQTADEKAKTNKTK